MTPARNLASSAAAGARVVVVGAGGNIGSHLLPHLGRMPGVREIELIDPGTYEPSNLYAQDITPNDVGRRKVTVQARRLRRINPGLAVNPLAVPVEDVPVGYLRATVILACLDSRAARQSVNQCAWLLGVPWIDAGVHADGLLGQVGVYVPGEKNPCLECAWDERDYAALEQTYPCAGADGQPPATGAPSSLGALAAALQAIECAKFLAGSGDTAARGRRVLIDASSHKLYVTAVRRNAACRMPEHEPWRVGRFRHSLHAATVDDILHLGRHADAARSTWSVVGRNFVTRLTCPDCVAGRRVLRLEGARGPSGRCAACGGAMVVAGFDLRGRLRFEDLAPVRSRSLAGIGLRRGDVFTVECADERRHYVVDGGAFHDRATSRRK